ncbi:hypothetical protein SIAM614_00195 [Stappia aggregata IAM 12614]
GRLAVFGFLPFSGPKDFRPVLSTTSSREPGRLGSFPRQRLKPAGSARECEKVRNGQFQLYQLEQRTKKPLGLPQGQMENGPDFRANRDGKISVLPPTDHAFRCAQHPSDAPRFHQPRP